MLALPPDPVHVLKNLHPRIGMDLRLVCTETTLQAAIVVHGIRPSGRQFGAIEVPDPWLSDA